MFHKHHSVWVAAALLVLVSLTVGVLIGSTLSTGTANEGALKTRMEMIDFSDGFAEIAERLNPSVVNINCLESPSAARNDDEEDDNDDDGEDDEDGNYGFGSGVIIDSGGYIITNNHVIDGASTIEVKLSDNRQFTAKLVGQDKETDLALIKVKSDQPLPAAPLGDSDRLRPGQWVMAIGNPFVYDHTVTVGVISAINRKLGTTIYDNFIQTDAAINFGNSGGPLLNIKGEVVGINTLISSQGTGIGFSIPINLAKEILAQLKEKGRISRGFLGLVPQEITPELRKSLGVSATYGVIVSSIQRGTPADDSGLKRYDVILEINGTKVQSEDHFRRLIADTPPGKTVRLKVMREEQVMELDSRVAEREPEKQAKQIEPDQQDRLGWNVEDMNGSGAHAVRIISVTPGRAAATAQLQEGDVILEINREPVENAWSLNKQLKESKPGDSFLLYVEREKSPLLITLTLN